MAIQRSHAHLSIIIDGHRWVGFSDDDQPYEFTWPELREGKLGVDGGHYGAANADFGCGFKIKSSDVSPSLQWAIQQRTMYLNAVRDGLEVPVLSGSITDLSFGISATLSGMTVDGEFPGWPGAAGSTNEVMFDVTQFTPNVDGGAFRAPLAT